jgi:hypothetical protein
MLISGKWMFVWLGQKEAQCFVVKFLDAAGNVRQAYSRGATSHEINEAIGRHSNSER